MFNQTIAGHAFSIDASKLTINDPGRFGGEPRYVPHYWDIYMDGLADRDDGTTLGFDVSAEDVAAYPELKNRRTVRLVQSDQGFIEEV